MLITENILSNAGSTRPPRNYRTLCFVLDRLAVAVSCGLPIAPVLRTLRSEPELTRRGPKGAAWRRRVALLAGDLEAGVPLSDALERRVAAFLPAHFVPALRAAEAADCVPSALPLLVRNLSASTRALQQLRGALTYPVMQFAVMASIISGLLVFIVPKFTSIFDEIAPGQISRHHQLLRLCGYVVGKMAPFLLWFVLALIALAVGRRFLARTPAGRRLIEACSRLIPVAGRLWRRIGLLEAASAVSGFLAAGVDVSRAARWAAESVETTWARKRLRRFAEALEVGTPWPDAWTALDTTAPLCDWMIRNAAAREQPRDGFQAVAEWAFDDVSRRCRRLCQWVEPVLVIGNGLVVAGLVYVLAGALFDTVYATLDLG